MRDQERITKLENQVAALTYHLRRLYLHLDAMGIEGMKTDLEAMNTLLSNPSEPGRARYWRKEVD